MRPRVRREDSGRRFAEEPAKLDLIAAFLPLIPAIFAEVAVGPDLGMVRTRRIVAVYDVGKVINQELARSQSSAASFGA